MSIRTIQANPIQHLVHDPICKEFYNEITGKSWEVRLIKWAETGGTVSKICRWAIIVFSGAIVVAAVHDKIKDVESHNAIKKAATATHQYYRNEFDFNNNSSDIDAINFIKKYTPKPDKITDANESISASFQAVEDVIPEANELEERRPKVSNIRAASWHAALYTEDFSDLIPKAKSYIEKTHPIADVQIEETQMEFTATVQEDNSGKESLTCSKGFSVLSGNIPIGYIIINRNFNPHAKDTVTFTYEPIQKGELTDLP